MAIMTLDQYNQQSGQGVDYDALFNGTGSNQGPNGEPEEVGMIENVGNILSTARQKASLRIDGLMASRVKDPELSTYARNFYAQEYQKHQDQYNKLGSKSQFAADVVGEAPAIAAYLSTPLTGAAGLATGATLSGYGAKADALNAQFEEGQEWDETAANWAGVGTAVTDTALSLTGAKLAQATARKFAGPGSVGITKALAPAAVDIAVADSASAAASQVYQNLASGRNWSDNAGTAALVGGAAGGAVRGVGKGFNGISEKLGIQFNKGGEDAITKATTINRESGMEANPEFANGYIDAENAAAGVKQRIDEMDIDDPDLGAAIGDLNTLNTSKAADAALVELGQMIPKLHMNTKGYDVTIKDYQGNSVNLARDVMGMSQRTVDEAITNTSKLKKDFFQTKHGEKEAGLTQEAFLRKLHDSYNAKFEEGRGHFGDNQFDINTELKKRQRDGSDQMEVQRLNDLRDDLQLFDTLVHESMATPSKAADVHNRVMHLSNRIRENAIRTGMYGQMKSFTGKKGDLDLGRDYLLMKGLHDSALAQDPSYVYGTADPLAAKAGEKESTPWTAVKSAVKAPAKLVINPYRKHKAKASLKAAQELGTTLAKRKPSVRADMELSSGNAAGAARASADALQDAGIVVKPVETPVVDAPVVESTTAPISDAPSSVAQRVRDELVAQERASAEAPMAPVAEPEVVPSTDARTKTAPSPKPVQEPTEPTPKPKPKAKSRTKPKQKEKKKKEGPSPEAVQAAQADLAAALQAAIKNGAKRGDSVDAQSRTSPASAGKKASKEAPTETREEFDARTKDAEKSIAEDKARFDAEEARIKASNEKRRSKSKPEERKRDKAEDDEKIKKDREEFDAKIKAEEDALKAEREKAKAAKAPKQKEAPVRDEPTQEDTQEAPQEPLGRKTPERKQKEAEPVEEPTEAPETKVEEPTVEEPKEVPYAKLVREPLEKIVNQKINHGVGKSNDLIAQRRRAERNLKDLKGLEMRFKDHTPEDIARVIHEDGGMEKMREAAKENQFTLSQQVKSRLDDMEGLRKREAAQKTREMKEILSKKEDAPATKVDETAVAKKAKREFDGEMEARGIHDEDLSQVNTAIENGMSHKNARVLAQRLNAERKANLKEEVKDRAETLKDANAVLKNQGKRDQVDEYLKGMDIEGDKDITNMINNVFKHRSDEVKPKEMQNLLNKIDRHLENQLDEYTSLMRAGGKADPRYPEWNDIANGLRTSVSDLKRNKVEVDRKYTKASENANEAATEHAQLTKEYDRLFDQANTRDANANKVVKQKDELVEELEGKGFTTEEAAAFTAEAFYKRETTPMNEREMQKTINKFVDQKAKEMGVAVDAKVKEVKAKVADADDATLEEMGTNALDDIEYSPSMESANNEIAIMKAIAEEMVKRNNPLGIRTKAYVEAVQKGTEMRAKYPDNPELWVPADLLTQMQKSFGTGTSSYIGRLGVSLRLALTGDREAKGIGRFDQKRLSSEVKRLEQKKDGKFFTDSEEFTAK